MFARFSPAARRVLRAAEQECRNLNHYYVGVEHLLLALLEERDPAIDARLADRASSPAELRAELRRDLGTGDDRLWDGILVTPRLRSVVEIAEDHVLSPGLVEPIDLFDAIVAEGGGNAAAILGRAGARSRRSQRKAI
ncbi:MAG: Clp protease N-terminal domain-containing protein [Vulcanimicrobiaceae bacterium]